MPSQKPPHVARVSDDGLALDEPATVVTGNRVPFRTDDWPARQRVRNLVRELRRPGPATAASSGRTPPDLGRLGPPQDLFGQLEHATAPGLASLAPRPSLNTIRQSRRSEGSQIVAWLIVLVGALAMAAGIGLVAWSLSSGQMLYWNLALGLALGGQGALILGLVLVVSRLWRSSRHAAGKLQDVHARLGQLQQTAEALAAMRAGGAPAFYADLVRSASPHVLLANLKGQVDQLATRVGSGW